jgi:hypothetical protein
MFVGHFGVALGAKKFAPTVSLGTLFLGCQLADLLWAPLVLARVERFAIEPGATTVVPVRFIEFPVSHSLAALGFWAVIFCALRAMGRRSDWATLIALGLVVISHWFLDVLAHVEDMPLTPGSEVKHGFRLWNSAAGTLAVEGLLLAAGAALYWSSTWGVNRKGTYGLWVLVGTLAGLELGAVLGPAPASADLVIGAAFSLWLLVLFAYWVDRNRTTSLR